MLDTTWQDDAACQGQPSEIFFRKSSEWRAKSICARCPVLEQCRAWNDEAEGYQAHKDWLAGVYAGENAAERAARRLEALEGVAS